MQILDNRNWEFPMGFTSRLIRKPTAARVRLFRESWKGQRSVINKRVPIWFVLNYRQQSFATRYNNHPFRIHNELSGWGKGIKIKLQGAKMHALRLVSIFIQYKYTILILKSLCKCENYRGITRFITISFGLGTYIIL